MGGVFITFEGGEGAGKSTQARRLAGRLRARGCEVVLTREPGGSPFAERLRAALLTDRGRALSPADQAILFAAARADHVDTVIRPALDSGRWVISDRFADSTAAYQGAAGAPDELLRALSTVAVGDTQPELTLLLDLPPAIGLARASARSTPDAFERDTLAVHEARRAAFLAVAEREPERVVVLDGAAGEEALADAVWHAVAERFDIDDAADEAAVAPAQAAAVAPAQGHADAPAHAAAVAPDPVPGGAPDSAPGPAQTRAYDPAPEPATRRAPDAAPDPAPGGAPDAAPEPTSELSTRRAPDAESEPTPDRSPPRAPDPAPEPTPGRSPRRAPDAAPEPAPDSSPRRAPDPAPAPPPDHSPRRAPAPAPDAAPDAHAPGEAPAQGAG